ncbi:MAG: bifunctional oligoribonuclease/PAP phosphatase NrnA, partial [Eubacterium sp.]|nr:bifunctional oligoribonuclease/PAP phosphatase NrnA [Eubacterium sp.]
MMKINDIIGDATKIGIAGHIRPDGDAIGSCMSLYNYLKKNRPDLDVRVHLEYVDPKYGIIENIDEVDTGDFDGTEYDLFIALDTASADRLGKNV